MQRSLCAYLQDVLDAAEAIHLFSAGMTFEDFESIDLVLSATERKFEIIGEALRQASASFPGSVDSVPELREVIGQRNNIAHAYFSVDPVILWKSRAEDLPALVAEVTRLKTVNGC